jgi:hypothetical protein
MAIATRMADKAKAGSETIKVKRGNGTGKGKSAETADASSAISELEESEGEISSADSSLPDPEVDKACHAFSRGDLVIFQFVFIRIY